MATQKAYNFNTADLSMKNESTSTIPAYAWCRLCTTAGSVDQITSRGTVTPFGITQEAINPSAVGKVAISGISKLKMGSTGYTTMAVTTPTIVGANASGKGIKLTTSVTMEMGGVALSTFAASDIISVEIAKFRALYRL
jgi:hypothetical protein